MTEAVRSAPAAQADIAMTRIQPKSAGRAAGQKGTTEVQRDRADDAGEADVPTLASAAVVKSDKAIPVDRKPAKDAGIDADQLEASFAATVDELDRGKSGGDPSGNATVPAAFVFAAAGQAILPAVTTTADDSAAQTTVNAAASFVRQRNSRIALNFVLLDKADTAAFEMGEEAGAPDADLTAAVTVQSKATHWFVAEPQTRLAKPAVASPAIGAFAPTTIKAALSVDAALKPAEASPAIGAVAPPTIKAALSVDAALKPAEASPAIGAVAPPTIKAALGVDAALKPAEASPAIGAVAPPTIKAALGVDAALKPAEASPAIGAVAPPTIKAALGVDAALKPAEASPAIGATAPMMAKEARSADAAEPTKTRDSKPSAASPQIFAAAPIVNKETRNGDASLKPADHTEPVPSANPANDVKNFSAGGGLAREGQSGSENAGRDSRAAVASKREFPQPLPPVGTSEIEAQPVALAAVAAPAQQIKDVVLDVLGGTTTQVQPQSAPAAASRPAAPGYVLRSIEVTLAPADLGVVKLKLSLKDNSLAIDAEAAKASTAKLLNDDRGVLEQNLREAGYDVSAVRISDASPASSSAFSNNAQTGGTGNPRSGDWQSAFGGGDAQRRGGSSSSEQQGRFVNSQKREAPLTGGDVGSVAKGIYI